VPGTGGEAGPPRTLDDWLEHIAQGHPREIALGLERVAAVRDRLGLVLEAVVLTVGGTNGKGSCVALLEAILRAAGYRVGAYASPHLLRYNERVRLDGVEATDAALGEAFGAVEAARGAIPLTYFEHGTLAALWLFARAGLDAIVLEVGLGGRLDAVNVIDPDAALVTTVDLDHQDWLGPDREAIGREKAGIFRSGRPAIYGGEDPPASLLAHAATIGADLRLAGRDFEAEMRSADWDYRSGGARRRAGLPLPALRGTFQLANAAAVLATLEAVSARLPVGNAAVREGLLAAQPAGRFQVFPGPVTAILDVAHNPQAARALGDNLRRFAAGQGRTLAVFSMLADKDIAAVASALAPEIAAWYYAPLPVPRGASAAALADRLGVAAPAAPRHGFGTLAEAWRAAHAQARPGDRVLAFGSFYTVAALLPLARAAEGPLL
jgi:dihydrofolate synthase/folylpolyglutamate synthase